MSARSTFAGTSVPASVVPDLERAVAAGFRVEASKRGDGIVVYPADRARGPIHWGSREANPAHENNLRLALRRAGLPDEGAEPVSAKSAPPKESPMSVIDMVDQSENVPETVAQILAGLATRAGVDRYAAMLLGAMVEIGTEFALSPEAVQFRTSANEAERLAAALLQERDEAREKAAALEARLASAKEREDKARADCGAALDRARKAEARAEALERGLAPLKALLAT